MTLRDGIHKVLVDRGLSPDDATAVLGEWLASPDADEARDRMDDEDIGYPTALMACWRLTLYRCAIRWIDANRPKHFARSVFLRMMPGHPSEPFTGLMMPLPLGGSMLDDVTVMHGDEQENDDDA